MTAEHLLASDQHPDHHVLEGERFIATVYNAIRQNPALWASTALLITYDEHGGIYDHVPPPACTPDGFVAQPKDTKTDRPFLFDRLGVRVPAILVSPWVAKGTVVDGRVFEHASIPATVTKWLLPGFDETQRTPRERAAETFLDLLSLPAMRMDSLSRGAAAPGDRSSVTPELAVPKRPRNAFNPNRRASGLIKAQIEHLEAAAGIRRAKTARRKKERSEGEAAAVHRTVDGADLRARRNRPRAGDGRAATAISSLPEPRGRGHGPARQPARSAPRRRAGSDRRPSASRLPARAETVRADAKGRAPSMRRLVMLACLSLAAPLAAQTPAPTTQDESAFHAELRREGERLKETCSELNLQATRRLRRRPGHRSSASRQLRHARAAERCRVRSRARDAPYAERKLAAELERGLRRRVQRRLARRAHI